MRREFDSPYPHKNKELDAKRLATLFLAVRKNRTEGWRSLPAGNSPSGGRANEICVSPKGEAEIHESDRFSLPALYETFCALAHQSPFLFQKSRRFKLVLVTCLGKEKLGGVESEIV